MAGFARNLSIAQTRARIARQLKAIAASVRAEMQSGLVADMKPVAETVKRLAPKDQGDLIASVHVEELPAPRIGAQLVEGDDKAYYVKWVENGTQKMAARPHFWPAWRAARKQLKAKRNARVRRAIKKGAATQ